MSDVLHLEQLVKVYEDKAEEHKLWVDYVKAHGLANGCLVRDRTEERLWRVYSVEEKWYDGEHPFGFPEFQALIHKHKQMLTDYRERSRLQFDSIKHGYQLLDIEDVFEEDNLENALKFSKAVFQRSEQCTEDFIKCARYLIGSSVDALSRLGQNPPCPFAVIGLGSVARGEATPYSDLEYGFVVETEANLEYFQMLAVDTYFRLTNLDETPLRSFNIKELSEMKNTSELEPNQEERFVEKSGFRFDGITYGAGNIPTGNALNKKGLTFTVSQFLNRYKDCLNSPPGEQRGDLAVLLSTSVLVFANEGGHELYNDMMARKLEYENIEAGHDVFVTKKRLNTLILDVEHYGFLPEFNSSRAVQDAEISVKEDIFRYPTLLANNLKIYLRLLSDHPWQVHAELHDLGVLSDENYRYMNIVLAISIYIRTCAYLDSGAQSKYLSIYTSSQGPATDLYHVPCALFVTLGCLLVPIKQSIKSGVERRMTAESSPCDVVDVVNQLVGEVTVPKSNFMLKASVLYFTGCRKMALSHLYQILGETNVNHSSNFIGKIRERYGTTQLDPAEEKYLHIGFILFYTDKPKYAVEYARKIVAYQKSNLGIIQWKLLEAKCLNEIHEYKSALSVITQMMSLFKQALSIDGEASLHAYALSVLENDVEVAERLLPFFTALVELLFVQVFTTYRLCRYQEAEELCKLALTVCSKFMSRLKITDRRALYNTMCHFTLLSCLGYIESCNNKSEDALQHYAQALDILKAVFGENANHPDIAGIYNDIGSVFNTMGEYNASLCYFNDSLRMKKVLYGKNSNHPETAIAYNNIGGVHWEKGEQEQALKNFQTALAMRRAWFGEQTNHPDIANSYSSIGSVYMESGASRIALDYFSISLNMRNAVYGENAIHTDLAVSHHNIGYAWKDLGDNGKALFHLTKALNIWRIVHNKNVGCPEVIMSWNLIGQVYYAMENTAEALRYYSQASSLWVAAYGEEVMYTGMDTTYIHMAKICYSMGDYARALDHYMKALKLATPKPSDRRQPT